jgi:hypothetical protein
MGAYVQWVPEKKLVVVRYVAAPIPTPPPTPPPTPKPLPPATPPPTPPPTPSPTPKPIYYEKFVVGDYVFRPKVYNEFSNGITGNNASYAVRGAIEFPAFGLPWMVEGDYRSYTYQHNSTYPAPGVPAATYAPPAGDPGYVTNIGGLASTYVYGFTARDTDIDGRFGLKVVDPRIYVGVGYLSRSENYGYPRQNGFGFGAEKLPDLDQPFSVYGSVWYYPSISGNYTYPDSAPADVAGTTSKFQQRFLKYQIGGTFALGGTGLFLDAGFLGDQIRGKNLSPSDASHSGGYVGLGLKF